MSIKLAIFTDLDGTLLDKKTYQPGPALKYLKKCYNLNVPVVFVSGKTRAEIESVRIDLDNKSPFISENGGGLYIPRKDFPDLEGFREHESYWYWQAIESIDEIQNALFEAARRVGVEVKSFSQMSIHEVAELTGLSLKQAELAKIRKHDEPFIIINQTPKKLTALKKEISRLKLNYTTGGYLHHITGKFDKGQTVSLLINIYKRANSQIRFAGLGDALNDLPMLEQVDYPFLVRRPDKSYDSGVQIKNLTVTRGIGPSGFAEAVSRLIEKLYQ